MNSKPLLHLLALCAVLLSATTSARAQTTLISTNTIWRYLDDGSDQGTAWRGAGFNDSGWSNGVPLFGFDSSPVYPWPFRTPMPVSTNRITYYFRTHFTWSGDPAGAVLTANCYLDDGAAFYLNGVEAARVRLTNNPVTFDSLAINQGAEGSLDVVTLSPASLVVGDNVLAVEAHQTQPTSSDIAFGLTLEGGTNPAPFAVALTDVTPTNGPVGTNVTATALATDPVGIARVEFRLDGQSIFSDTNNPYAVNFGNLTAGTHVLSAIAYNLGGQSATSAPVSVVITNEPGFTYLVRNGSVWKYLDDGSDQGTAWRAPGFNDSAWSSGPAELGYGDHTDNPPRPERTVINGGPATNRIPTAYFRHTFTVANPAAYSNLVVGALRDDGAVVYLNDVEIFRSNLPLGPVNFATFTGVNAPEDGANYVYSVNSVDTDLLVPGANVVAVEMHQSTTNSSDLSFDLMLLAQAPSNQPPAVVRGPEINCSSPGLAVTFSVQATGSAPLTYQWKKNSVDIPGATAASYTIASVAASDVGNYQVQVSNPFGSVLSANATLTVGLPLVNPSFEVDTFTNWPGYVRTNFPITGWTSPGEHGINPAAGSSPFADNGIIPHGTQVAFLQQDGAISQTVSGFTVGATYHVEYRENARNCCSGTVPSIEVKIGGVPIVNVHSVPVAGAGNPYRRVVSSAFIASASSLELAFIKSAPQGGDTTALIDGVCIVSESLVIMCATNKTVLCGSIWNFDPPTALDGGGGTNVVITVLATFTNGSCQQFITRTWLATDTFGHSNVCSQTVTIVTTNSPLLGCADDKAVPCAAAWTFDPPAALDACGSTNVIVTVLNTLTNGSGCLKIITRTWLATDCSGNTATCSQTVNLTDATPPLLTQQPQSQILAVGGDANFSVTATGTLPLTYNWYFNGVQISSSPSNRLAISRAQIANAGNYWAVIKNIAGAVTSLVANLNMLPEPVPSGLSLVITNNQGNVVIGVLDDGSSGYPWQLQSTTNLLNGHWLVETNGAGYAQFAFTADGRAKFFRGLCLKPANGADEIHALYRRLPGAQFNTRLLIAIGGAFEQSVLNSDGTLLDLNAPIPPSRTLSGVAFRDSYDTLRASSWDGTPTLPDLTQVKVTVHPTAQPVKLEQHLAEQDIYALALAVVPYNRLAASALGDGRLTLVDSNNTPIDLLNTNQQATAVFVVEGTNPDPYVLTNVFAGAGLFRTVLQSGTEPIKFMLPKELLVTMGRLDSLQIRFPGVPLVFTNGGTPFAHQDFVDIVPDQVFLWDFSRVNLDTNGAAEIPIVVRATIDGHVTDAVGGFSLRAGRKPPYHCSPTNCYYFYPQYRPLWWPASAWSTKPAPQNFFTDPIPGWWPTTISWPPPYSVYVAPHFPPLGFIQYFGVLKIVTDPQAWGPLYDSFTKAVGQGIQGGNNWSGGYNMRFYPATYKTASDPTRCQPVNLVVYVDGFDVHADRTQETIWDRFGGEGQKLLEKGYDLLVLDYIGEGGRDYIQRNAYALLNVLQNEIPPRMKQGHQNDRVAILAVSMGTLVTRDALVRAELNLFPNLFSQDHHTGLVIYLDGIFMGAGLPLSMQSLVQFLATKPPPGNSDAKNALDGLTSPASRQMRRTGINYAPEHDYYAYYNEVKLFGDPSLPRLARNVAIASASGLGLSPQGSQHALPPWNVKFADVSTGHHEYGNPYFSFGGITLSSWAEARVDARAEASQPLVLYVLFQGGLRTSFSSFWQSPPFFYPPFIDSLPLKLYSRSLVIPLGARPIDLSAGGWTPLGQLVVKAYNDSPKIIAAGMDTMTFDFGANNFVSAFSSLYVPSAERGVQPFAALQTDFSVSPTQLPSLTVIPIAGTRPGADFWYGPESGGTMIDPATPSKSPFDAIWYQYENTEHVISTSQSQPHLPSGTEAFLFNELDKFTSNERFTTESVLDSQPKMPLHEEYLAGDLLDVGVGQLLSINTLTRNAMVQSFNPFGTDPPCTVFINPQWTKLWDNSGSGMIGNWSINKGDKFFLARLNGGGQKLLICISASTPARAMVQQFLYNSGLGNWVSLWDNNSSGFIGNFKIHPTDLHAFGDTDGHGVERLLVAYPYVCNDYREKTVPGTSGLSKSSLLTFTGTGWTETWNNNANIHMLGATGIRFGDLLAFGRVSSSGNPFIPENLLTLNLLRGSQTPISPLIFGGPTFLQSFTGSGWSLQWTDGSQPSFGNCNPCNGHIGCWNLNDNPRDTFYFADLDGDGRKELIGANDLRWEAYDSGLFPGFPGQWCLKPFSADPNNGSMLGTYHLGIGDRFFFGNLDASLPGEVVLSLNPLPQSNGLRGPAVMQRWTPTGWLPVGNAGLNAPGYLGCWKMYQDLPQP